MYKLLQNNTLKQQELINYYKYCLRENELTASSQFSVLEIDKTARVHTI